MIRVYFLALFACSIPTGDPAVKSVGVDTSSLRLTRISDLQWELEDFRPARYVVYKIGSHGPRYPDWRTEGPFRTAPPYTRGQLRLLSMHVDGEEALRCGQCQALPAWGDSPSRVVQSGGGHGFESAPLQSMWTCDGFVVDLPIAGVVSCDRIEVASTTLLYDMQPDASYGDPGPHRPVASLTQRFAVNSVELLWSGTWWVAQDLYVSHWYDAMHSAPNRCASSLMESLVLDGVVVWDVQCPAVGDDRTYGAADKACWRSAEWDLCVDVFPPTLPEEIQPHLGWYVSQRADGVSKAYRRAFALQPVAARSTVRLSQRITLEPR